MNLSALTRATTYDPHKAAAFMRSRERFGNLSNMAPGFPLSVSGLRFQSSEGLYQAFKFPDDPKLQEDIANAKSGMDAKKIAYRPGNQVMPAWDDRRVHAMIITLACRLSQHPERFGAALAETNGLTIVEKSYRDEFWGAKPGPQELSGRNVLGKLLQELRALLMQHDDPQKAALEFSLLADHSEFKINGQTSRARRSR